MYKKTTTQKALSFIKANLKAIIIVAAIALLITLCILTQKYGSDNENESTLGLTQTTWIALEAIASTVIIFIMTQQSPAKVIAAEAKQQRFEDKRLTLQSAVYNCLKYGESESHLDFDGNKAILMISEKILPAPEKDILLEIMVSRYSPTLKLCLENTFNQLEDLLSNRKKNKNKSPEEQKNTSDLITIYRLVLSDILDRLSTLSDEATKEEDLSRENIFKKAMINYENYLNKYRGAGYIDKICPNYRTRLDNGIY